jgi:hypothetical protein
VTSGTYPLQSSALKGFEFFRVINSSAGMPANPEKHVARPRDLVHQRSIHTSGLRVTLPVGRVKTIWTPNDVENVNHLSSEPFVLVHQVQECHRVFTKFTGSLDIPVGMLLSALPKIWVRFQSPRIHDSGVNPEALYPSRICSNRFLNFDVFFRHQFLSYHLNKT